MDEMTKTIEKGFSLLFSSIQASKKYQNSHRCTHNTPMEAGPLCCGVAGPPKQRLNARTSASQVRTKPHAAMVGTIGGLCKTSRQCWFPLLSSHPQKHKGSSVRALSLAAIQIQGLLVLLVFCEDLGGILARDKWQIGVSDKDIENCHPSSPPEAMDRDTTLAIGLDSCVPILFTHLASIAECLTISKLCAVSWILACHQNVDQK